jgi:hypothetical protein
MLSWLDTAFFAKSRQSPKSQRGSTSVCCQAVQAVELRYGSTGGSTHKEPAIHLQPHNQGRNCGDDTDVGRRQNHLAGLRMIFGAEHFDIEPVQSMNGIAAAVGTFNRIPPLTRPIPMVPSGGCRECRSPVLGGITPNKMVRTRFKCSFSQDQVVDKYKVLGFDYNQEVHWIDHVPGGKLTMNVVRLKLHFIIKGMEGLRKAVCRFERQLQYLGRVVICIHFMLLECTNHVMAWCIWT